MEQQTLPNLCLGRGNGREDGERKARTKARYADTSAENETTEKVKMPEIQLSVNAGIGAECQLDKIFSVYVEPGVSHHFKNGNNLATIYKDRPTNFNLNIGLRCSLR